MKNSLYLLALLGLFTFAQHTALAEPAKIEHVIETLRAAKEAKEPLPLLQKAHEQLASYKPAPKSTGLGRKKAAAVKSGTREDKQDAMEAITDAIKVAKAGGAVKPKIDHAIALVNKTGDAKN